jgi:hypothetical protein
MPYGIIKVDQVTFTNAGVDQTISVSGIVASISGNITATGTISGNVIRGGTTVSGATVTGTAGQFGTITGNTAGFTTVTGTTATFTSGVFTNISGGTHTVTSGVFASGTAANPSITFQGDVNTGIYSPGADQVAVATNGTGRLFVNSTGAILDVAGTTRVANTTGNKVLQIGQSTPSANDGSSLEFQNSTTQKNWAIRTNFNVSGALEFCQSSAAGGTTYAPPSAVIDSSGRVGIGTTNPGAYSGQLVINISLSGDHLVFADDSTSSGAAAARLGCSGNNLVFKTNSGASAATERARIDSSGRLLVGTSSTSANTRFVLQGNSAGSGSAAVQHLCFDGATPASDDGLGFLIFGDNTQSQGAWITAKRDGGTWSGSSKPSRLEFSTTADGASSPTERMRITSGGEILIGVTSVPTAGNVNGTALNAPYLGDTASMVSAETSTGGSYRIVFLNSNGLVGSISTSGSGTSYTTSSDYRLKENIAVVTDGITRLQQLKPSRFNFIADPDRTVDGFIAHEAQAVVPECVTGTKDEVDDDGNPVYQGIDQSKLVPLLTAALQEAIGRIETLEAEVSALKGA